MVVVGKKISAFAKLPCSSMPTVIRFKLAMDSFSFLLIEGELLCCAKGKGENMRSDNNFLDVDDHPQ